MIQNYPFYGIATEWWNKILLQFPAEFFYCSIHSQDFRSECFWEVP